MFQVVVAVAAMEAAAEVVAIKGEAEAVDKTAVAGEEQARKQHFIRRRDGRSYRTKNETGSGESKIKRENGGPCGTSLK
jgi:hypothetical protein